MAKQKQLPHAQIIEILVTPWIKVPRKLKPRVYWRIIHKTTGNIPADACAVAEYLPRDRWAPCDPGLVEQKERDQCESCHQWSQNLDRVPREFDPPERQPDDRKC